MTKLFYSKLAFNNIKNNKKERAYLIYYHLCL